MIFFRLYREIKIVTFFKGRKNRGVKKNHKRGVSEGMLFRVKFIWMDVELKSKKKNFEIFENFSKCLGGSKKP